MPVSVVSHNYEYHCREAARWAGYTFVEFCALEVEEQAATVAHYELHHKLEYLMKVDSQRKGKR